MRKLPRTVVFFKTLDGNEPVREWLQSLSKEEKKIIGEDIKTVQGTLQWRKPLVDFLGSSLWEVRSTLPNTIARIFFCEVEGEMVLLHAIKKKTKKTPTEAIQLVKTRKKQYECQEKK